MAADRRFPNKQQRLPSLVVALTISTYLHKHFQHFQHFQRFQYFTLPCFTFLFLFRPPSCTLVGARSPRGSGAPCQQTNMLRYPPARPMAIGQRNHRALFHAHLPGQIPPAISGISPTFICTPSFTWSVAAGLPSHWPAKRRAGWLWPCYVTSTWAN